MKLRPEVLCIQEIIYDIVQLTQFVAEKKGIKMDMAFPIDYIYIRADYEKMVRVINNLIENAVKYAPDQTGKIVVRVENEEKQVILSVEDNGPGIGGDHKETVFDKFVQVQKHVGPGKHGTGLGLAICKELVHLHGGRIWVEDNPGGGAIFKVLLPEYIQQDTENPQDEPAEQITSA